jgi:threonine-phosphate decarboxylase
VLFDVLPPAHGGQLRQIAARYRIRPERLLDFSANINPAGPPSSVLSAIRRALDEPSTLAMYPDLELIELKTAVAEHTGTQRENIAVANGFVPLLDAALRSLKIKRCLLPIPSFREYRITLENAGVSITPYQLSSDEDFRYVSDES